VGRKLKAGEACAVVESVKTASDIYAPIGGEVIEEIFGAVFPFVGVLNDFCQPSQVVFGNHVDVVLR